MLSCCPYGQFYLIMFFWLLIQQISDLLVLPCAAQSQQLARIRCMLLFFNTKMQKYSARESTVLEINGSGNHC